MKNDKYFEVFNKIVRKGYIDGYGDGETLMYLTVENNQENRNILKEIGIEDVTIFLDEHQNIDLVSVADDLGFFNWYFDGKNFIPYEEGEEGVFNVFYGK